MSLDSDHLNRKSEDQNAGLNLLTENYLAGSHSHEGSNESVSQQRDHLKPSLKRLELLSLDTLSADSPTSTYGSSTRSNRIPMDRRRASELRYRMKQQEAILELAHAVELTETMTSTRRRKRTDLFRVASDRIRYGSFLFPRSISVV